MLKYLLKILRGKGWDLGAEPLRVKLCRAPSLRGILRENDEKESCGKLPFSE